MFSRWRLRQAALTFAAHGWRVIPGACLATDRFDCGRPGCPTMTCHPALEHWEQAACRNSDRIAGWWRYAPHSVLLPTGDAFDVLEVPAPLGVLVAASSRWHGPARGPVAATPAGRWMFLIQPGQPLPPELARRSDVVRHTHGSWVPAPPTRLADGPVRWIVSPQETAWRLPVPGEPQQLLVDAITGVTLAAA